jgi:D-glycero-alpha-D-manno-heptose-7-phosphate kinase
MLKREIARGISNGKIDEWYEHARAAGALGGKILGAGAGGFLMLYAPQASHASILAALPDLRPVKMGFEPLGSRIIFYH